MPYRHGTYGIINSAQDALLPQGVGTLPVYIGTAPVHTLDDYSAAVNVPVLARTLAEAEAALGYSNDWASFTLCEAMFAHFCNAIKPIGPIVLINVMDPATHKTAGTETIHFNASHQATIGANKGERVILSSVAITGKALGTDFSAVLDSINNEVIITDLLSAYGTEDGVSVAYNYMDVTTVQASDIVGGVAGGAYKGIACVDKVYQQLNLIPLIIGAPGWSQIKAVYEAMVAKAVGISEKFKAIAVVDIDSGDAGAKSKSAALTLKVTNAYNSEYAKVCWPKARRGTRRFWLSTLAAVRMQQTDFANGNIPYVSPSNKQIDADGLFCADNTTTIILAESEANELNAKGITTAIFSGGVWKLWGPHNGNYEYGVTSDASKQFDASIRMMHYLSNNFQVRYLDNVDNPMSRRQVETILNDAQIWLNALIAEGKLLYAQIDFLEASNSTADVAEGDFTFDVRTTTTPVGKSLTFVIQYTADGISSLFGGESNA